MKPITDDDKKAECSVCGVILNKRKDNLLRHFQTKHTEELVALSKETKLIRTEIVTRDDYISNIIEIMTQCNLPFTFWSRPAVQLNQQALCDAFNVTCSSTVMHSMLKNYSVRVRMDISRELSGKLICIKFDIATRKNKHILGISVQYIDFDEWEIVIRYLGMTEITKSTKAADLRILIEQRLQQYNLDVMDIFASVTDNGGNVLRTPKDLLRDIDFAVDKEDADFLQSHLELIMDDFDWEEEEPNERVEDEAEMVPPTQSTLPDPEQSLEIVIEDNHQEMDIEEPIILGHDVADPFFDEGMEPVDQDHLENELGKITKQYTAKETRCAAHVVQLAVKDFMKIHATQEFILELKQTVKSVRSYIGKLPSNYKDRPRKPRFGNDTRWNTNYDMVRTEVVYLLD